ncbi:nucleolar protein dao-5-like [Ornithodoros turicata]|uniref:nucleolar protein dao-5-like n=1 Tax=Ornithodoros turicata TaxID=34597 RepID=UPI003138CEC3
MFQSDQNLCREADSPGQKISSENQVKYDGEGRHSASPVAEPDTLRADPLPTRISQTSNGGDTGLSPSSAEPPQVSELEPCEDGVPSETVNENPELREMESVLRNVIQIMQEPPVRLAEKVVDDVNVSSGDLIADPQASTSGNDEPAVRFAMKQTCDSSENTSPDATPKKSKVARPVLKHREPPKNTKPKNTFNDRIRFFARKKPAQNKIEKPASHRVLEVQGNPRKPAGPEGAEFLSKLSFLDNIDRKITWGKAKTYPGSVTVSELNDDRIGTTEVNRMATKVKKRKKQEPQPKPKFEGISLLRSILGISSPSPNRKGAITNTKNPKRSPSAKPTNKQSPSRTPRTQSPRGKKKSLSREKMPAKEGSAKTDTKEEASAESVKSATSSESESTGENNTSQS